MSTTYKIVNGDTFESIARKRYGTDEEAGRIERANPGVSEPLSARTTLIVPAIPEAPKDSTLGTPSQNINEVALLIDGHRFRFWSDISIDRALDRIDTVSFSAPFQADLADFRETFKPFTYKSIQITVGGVPLFEGTMVSITPMLGNDSKTIQVEGYSTPGVLNDCTAPATMDQLEFNGIDLLSISNALCEPFGVGVQFDEQQGPKFERVALSSSKNVLPFIIGLAQQRNLIVSNTPDGKLLFGRAIETGQPVANLEQGSSPLLSVTPSFDAQNYFSHVTGIESVTVGLDGSKFTVKNTRLEGIVRPTAFKAKDSQSADIKAATEAKAGRMFGGASAYTIALATWRDAKGNLWKPNTIIKLFAPDAMIYTSYAFVVRSVQFNKNAIQETAVIELALPGAFSGKIPEVLPWDS